MALTAIGGARRVPACVTYQFPATTTAWGWPVGRIGTALMEWMSTCALAIVASLEDGVRSTLTSVRESTAVAMADVLMEWIRSTVIVRMATMVHCVSTPSMKRTEMDVALQMKN